MGMSINLDEFIDPLTFLPIIEQSMLDQNDRIRPLTFNLCSTSRYIVPKLIQGLQLQTFQLLQKGHNRIIGSL